MTVEEYSRKDRRLSTAFMDSKHSRQGSTLECSEDLRCQRTINGRNKRFYRKANACVKVVGEFSDCNCSGSEAGMYNVAMVV